MKNIFSTVEENVSIKSLVLLMLIAYTFSVAIRLIWVYQFHGYAPFYWHGQLMINTNDGYYFASWVQSILDGVHQYNPRIEDNPFRYAIVLVTVAAVKLLGISINTAILYMPTVISSLVVIPIILIARLYKLSIVGFFAALVGSVAWSYYNRTMTGYYDTDMFSAMAPMFILYFLIKLIEQNEMKNILNASFMIAIYPILYDQGQAIVYAMGLIFMAYMVIFHLKSKFTYKSITLVSIALMPLPYHMQVLLFVVVFLVFLKREFELKTLMIVSAVFVLAFLFSGDVFGLIISKVASYAVRGTASNGLHFFGVNQTVREAGKIPFSVMANRISGSTLGVLVALVGYILMTLRYKPFVLALPLIGIGVFSLWGGLRFTVYAVPIAAMGAIYLFYFLANFVSNTKIKYTIISLLTLAMLYPNITHILGYRVPTVFTKAEVKVLHKLNQISSPKDYTLTWWDYGYPIWYYSDTNTLIDGGKHDDDNFIVSKILTTTSQVQAANLARLSIETYAKYKDVVADRIFKDRQKNQINPNKFLQNLKKQNYKLPAKTRDIFLYLPSRMLGIFPTVNIFSNIDLETGKQKRRPFFYVSRRFRDIDGTIDLGNGIKLLQKSDRIQIGRQEIKIDKFAVTFYDKKGKLHKRVQVVDENSPISVIYMKNYNTFLVLDKNMYNSTYIQLFVLENYNKKLFEPVILTPLAKVYKLKK